MGKKYLTLKELCEYLGYSKPSVYKLIDSGLPFVQFGKTRRFVIEDVDKWVNGGYKAKPKPKLKVEKEEDRELIQAYEYILGHLNDKLGRYAFRFTTKSYQKLIKARLKEGFTLEDFIRVIDYKYWEWHDNDMSKFLRPSTLFGGNFEGYLSASYTEENKQIVKQQKLEESLAFLEEDYSKYE